MPSQEAAMLAHDILGHGPHTLALLHGVGGGRRIWDDEHSGTARALAEAGWRVVALDLPGYGDSPLPEAVVRGETPLDAGTMAQAVIDTLTTLQARPAVLLGHSMGGMVAQEIALRDPAAVQALVLACTSSAFGKPGGEWQQGFLQARLGPLDAGRSMREMAQALVTDMVSPQADVRAVPRGVDIMARVPQATYRAALRGIVAFDRRAALPQLAMPVLCLAAEHDRTAPPELMARMAERLPNGRSHVLRGAGHLANVEQPEAFVQAVVAFLNTLSPDLNGGATATAAE